jgi:hypothetical protein
MLLTFICLFLVVELKRDWYSIQTLLGLLYQNRNMQSASPQGVHACFFLFTEPNRFRLVALRVRNIILSIWDCRHRLGFSRMTTARLHRNRNVFTEGSSVFFFWGGGDMSMNFNVYLSACVIIEQAVNIWFFLIYSTEVFEWKVPNTTWHIDS